MNHISIDSNINYPELFVAMDQNGLLASIAKKPVNTWFISSYPALNSFDGEVGYIHRNGLCSPKDFGYLLKNFGEVNRLNFEGSKYYLSVVSTNIRSIKMQLACKHKPITSLPSNLGPGVNINLYEFNFIGFMKYAEKKMRD
jgi:hypothetical protein